MSRLFFLSALLIGLALPAAAQDFRAENRVKVRGGDGAITVFGDGGFGARGVWCAAADYAKRVAGARSSHRLYVASPRTRGVGEASTVTFSLQPRGQVQHQVLLLGASLHNPGANLSVGHAYRFCHDARLVRTH